MNTRYVLATALVLALATFLAGCPENGGPPEEKAFEHVVFDQRLSLDQIEQQHPLTAQGRAELTPENVATLAQWQVDQLYARLTAGAIPDGPWQGRFFFAPGGGPRNLSEALGGVSERIIDFKLEELTKVGEQLWKGKVFYKDQGVLRNMIDYERVVTKIFHVDPGDVRTEEIDGREVALLFPAKLYCGDSLNDPRRESVIIDYSETQTIEGYVPKIDYLAGHDALNIRDEIRFVRPGFYLGLAYYLQGKLLLTFTLYNEAAASSGVTPAEECWDGRGPRPEPPAMADEEATEEAGADAGDE